MIAIQENVSLRPFNTFGIDVSARFFCRVSSVEELQELILSETYQRHPHYVLGEGSNVLFTRNYSGLIIRMEIKGVLVVAENEDDVVISAGAGESWHGLVMQCVSNGWGGVENLALIPGTCGAAPIQNIGAYGVEIKNLIQSVTAIDASTAALRTFQNHECLFDYRESVFKRALSKKYFISSITLTLTKKNHLYNVGYGAVKDTLQQHNIVDEKQLTLKNISDAVIEIRQQKLPDVRTLGSAGSFFKNPLVTQKQYEELKTVWTKIPSYPAGNQNVKIPAGWLIEQCGWKGKRFGNIGVHEHQALVLVNYGGGSGSEIFKLAEDIRASVKEKFGIELESEVNIIG